MKLIGILLIIAVSTGCAKDIIGSTAWFNDGGGKSELGKRASFDMSCDQNQLTFTPLTDQGYKVVGVTGCGKKATYVQEHGVWYLQSDESKGQ